MALTMEDIFVTIIVNAIKYHLKDIYQMQIETSSTIYM